jgi:hypothetical protein
MEACSMISKNLWNSVLVVFGETWLAKTVHNELFSSVETHVSILAS